MPWSPDDDDVNAPSPSPSDPPWLQRFVQAYAQPKERWTDVVPQLMAANQTGQNPASAAAASGGGVGRYNLPGVGPTYLNPDFANRVGQFIGNAKKRGVDVQFTSGYRTQARQDGLHNDPTATTPAKNSLHSAGRGADIELPSLANGQVDRAALNALVADAAAAGLSWGGHFKNPAPDPRHFYYDPGGDRQTLINQFSQGINRLKNQIPDY